MLDLQWPARSELPDTQLTAPTEAIEDRASLAADTTLPGSRSRKLTQQSDPSPHAVPADRE